MILVNGRKQDHLPVADRGLHFGDGVFETMAVDAGRALCLERHLARLAAGCAGLGIVAPEPATLEQECARACHGIERGVLKLMVTRGTGGRGYGAQQGAPATRIVARYPWPTYAGASRSAGVAVRICQTRLGRNLRLAGIKHLNRLEQVLARNEQDPGRRDEGLMLDDRDRVIEGIMSNVFIYRDGRLCTPQLLECGVAGIMRELVLEASRDITGSAPQIQHLSVDDLLSADECFLTNSLIGIWPVKSIEQHTLHVGPVARELQTLLTDGGAISRD
jgi:4-amino-4-deoxychorismate lyase